MTLLDLLKRITREQKIDLFNQNCTVIELNLTRGELIDTLLKDHQKRFGDILNAEVQYIEVSNDTNHNLTITLNESF